MRRVPTEKLVTLLVRDLEPTRRIPRLRTQFAAILGVGGLSILLVVVFRGLRPEVLALLLSGAFGLVAAGLLAAALGTCAAALASVRPDRGPLAKRALLCGGGGLALAAAVVAFCFAGLPAAAPGAEAAHEALACSVSGIVFALPLSVLAAFLVSSGTPRRLGLTAAVAALGSTAFGALAVHLTCPSPSVWHWITAHAGAPLLGAALLAGPVRALALRFERMG